MDWMVGLDGMEGAIVQVSVQSVVRVVARLYHVVQVIVLEVRHQRDAQTARLVPHVGDGAVAEGGLVWVRRMGKMYVDR